MLAKRLPAQTSSPYGAPLSSICGPFNPPQRALSRKNRPGIREFYVKPIPYPGSLRSELELAWIWTNFHPRDNIVQCTKKIDARSVLTYKGPAALRYCAVIAR